MRAPFSISLLFLSFFLVYSISPVSAQPVPELSDTLIDFGVVPKSISHTKPFFVRNVGDAMLIISNVIVGNAINFSVTPTALAVDPGDSGQVNVTLTPWWTLGTFSTTITVVSFNAQPDSLYLEAIGEGVPDAPLISVSPMMLSATLDEGEQSVQQLRIQNIGSEPLYWSKSTSDPVVRVMGGISPLDPFAWRDLDVTFPYTPVPPGEYHYTITFTSDDPYNPTLVVPVDLTIPGVPAAAADPDSIDFGLVYFGYASDRMIAVTNIGTGILHVSDISSDNSDFSVTPSAFDLGSFHSQDVTVTCDPTVAGTINATLTIVSDDTVNPNLEVYATANTSDLIPPILSVPPDTIEVTLLPGAKTNRMVTISNLGQGNLKWSASIRATSTELILDSMKVLVDDSKGYSGFFNGDAADFISAMEAQGVNFVHNTNHSITPLMLALYDAVIIPYLAGSNGGGYEQSELDAFHDYVLGGCGMMIHGYGGDRTVSLNSLLSSLGSGISIGDNYTANPWVTQLFGVEFTAGIDSIYQSSQNAEINVVPPGAVFANNDEQIHGAYFESGGRILVLANKVYRNSDVNVAGADNIELLLQMFTWLNMKTPGRSLTPDSGVIPGGRTDMLIIYFDADDMEEGTYTADIILTHDGPGAVEVAVPTAMIIDPAATGIEQLAPPYKFALYQNHPNPFNPSTTIEFETAGAGRVMLGVYDVAGRLVKILVDEWRDAGRYAETWNGRDGDGKIAASGVYFYRLQSAAFSASRKMILLK